MRRDGVWTLVVLLLLSSAGCGGGTPGARSAAARVGEPVAFEGAYPISAVATVAMVGDIVRHVGGPHVRVTQIMGAGVDPHLYKASRDDVASILHSDIVFYCGLMLEGKMADTLVKISRRRPVHAVADGIDPRYLLDSPDSPGHHDPHVWMDVAAWSECLLAAANVLAHFDPSHAPQYQARADAYRGQLMELHAYGVRSIRSIPVGNRVLITSHDAFNYFGRAYGMQVLGVQGLSTESEAGLQRINQLVDLIVDKKVRAVFVESSVSGKSIEALLDGAAARGHQVSIGGQLFSDAMGEEGTYEGTYMGMLDHNITLVTRAWAGRRQPAACTDSSRWARRNGHDAVSTAKSPALAREPRGCQRAGGGRSKSPVGCAAAGHPRPDGGLSPQARVVGRDPGGA